MWWYVLLGTVALELMNYLYYRYLVKFVELKRYYHDTDSEWMKKYLLDTISTDELRQWIKNTVYYTEEHHDKDQHFVQVPLNAIMRGNMYKWMCYMLYFRSMWQLNAEQLKEAKRALRRVERKLGFRFRDGYNKKIFFLKYGNAKIKTKYKPVIVYALLCVIKWITYGLMKSQGFKTIRSPNGILYWYRFNKPNKPRSATIFVHGIGFGIAPYYRGIMALEENENVILPVLPNISMAEFLSVFERATSDGMFPPYETWIKEGHWIIDHFGLNRINLVSHSFGSVVLSLWIRDKIMTDILHKVVMVDPVCFIDQTYRVFRFINEPTRTSQEVMNYALSFMMYHDIYIKYVCMRFMYGPRYLIHDYHNLKKLRLLVLLSENDEIVPAKAVKHQLKINGIKYLMAKDASHADIMYRGAFKDYLMAIPRYLSRDDI